MKIVSKIKSFILLLPLIGGLALTQSCTESLDEGARYTFTGNTVISYLEKHSDVYSEYLALLDTVTISDFSNSKVSQLLAARGNYTCFAPTNEAIHNYLVHLVDEARGDEPHRKQQEEKAHAMRDTQHLNTVQRHIGGNNPVGKSKADGGYPLAPPAPQHQPAPAERLTRQRSGTPRQPGGMRHQ